MEVSELKCRIKSSIEEVINARSGRLKYGYHSKWDFEMETLWMFIPQEDHLLKDKQKFRTHTYWQAPSFGWEKLNFDGASRGNPGSSGSGGHHQE